MVATYIARSTTYSSNTGLYVGHTSASDKLHRVFEAWNRNASTGSSEIVPCQCQLAVCNPISTAPTGTDVTVVKMDPLSADLAVNSFARRTISANAPTYGAIIAPYSASRTAVSFVSFRLAELIAMPKFAKVFEAGLGKEELEAIYLRPGDIFFMRCPSASPDNHAEILFTQEDL